MRQYQTERGVDQADIDVQIERADREDDDRNDQRHDQRHPHRASPAAVGKMQPVSGGDSQWGRHQHSEERGAKTDPGGDQPFVGAEERAVPAQRPNLGRKSQIGRVGERHRNDDKNRPEQEQQNQAAETIKPKPSPVGDLGIRGLPAQHSQRPPIRRSIGRARPITTNSTMVTANSTTPSALAAPQSKYSAAFSKICIDTMVTLPPPSSAGVT